MTVIYSNGFDGETTGQLPSGWINAQGSWVVGTTDPVSGKDLEAQNYGDVALYSGLGALARHTFSFQFRRGSGSTGGVLHAFYRADANFNNCYRVNYAPDGSGLTIYKRINGNYIQIATPGNTSFSSSVGDVIAFEAAVNGSDHAIRIWNATNSQRPTSPTYSFSDGDVASGFPGICRAGDGPAGVVALDNVTIDDQQTAPLTTISRLNPALFWSPYNQRDDGTSMNTNCTNAYVKFSFTGTSLTMNTVALPSGLVGYPVVRAFVDDAAPVDITLTPGNTSFSIASGLGSGTHTVQLVVTSLNQQDDYWDLVSAVRITGFSIDNGATVAAPTARSKTAILFGDSIPQGYIGTAFDALLTYVPSLMEALDAEFGSVCYGGQGYTQPNATSGVPALATAYSQYSAGVSRLAGGALPTAPDYLIDVHGTNPQTGAVPTQADIAAQLAKWRTIAPTAWIFMVVPMGGYARAAKTAATNAAIVAGDTKIALIDAGPSYDRGLNQPGTASAESIDGVHPYQRVHPRHLARWARQIQHVIELRRFTQVVTA